MATKSQLDAIGNSLMRSEVGSLGIGATLRSLSGCISSLLVVPTLIFCIFRKTNLWNPLKSREVNPNFRSTNAGSQASISDIMNMWLEAWAGRRRHTNWTLDTDVKPLWTCFDLLGTICVSWNLFLCWLHFLGEGMRNHPLDLYFDSSVSLLIHQLVLALS